MADHLQKKNASIGLVITLALVLVAAGVLITHFACSSNNGTRQIGKPLVEVLEEEDFEGDISDWLGSLSDESVAALDIAYESSIENGYDASKDKSEWATDVLRGYVDNNGDLVVVMPEGGEITTALPKNDSDEANASNEKSNEGTTSDNTHNDSQGTPTLSVGQVSASKGDTNVALPITIENNPGVLGMTIAVSYDESALTLVRADNGAALKDVLNMTHSQTFATGCLFMWDGIDVAPEDVKDGVALTLYFDVSNDASGLYPVVLFSPDAAYDTNLKEIDLALEDGYVVVG